MAEMTSLAVPACYKSRRRVLLSATQFYIILTDNCGGLVEFEVELELTIMVYRRALVKPLVPSRPAAVLNSASKSDCDFAAPVVKVLP